MWYGFRINHEYKEDVSFYAPDSGEQKEWIQALKKASRTSNVKDDYEIKKVCGTGKFSTVYRAIDRNTLEDVAIKVIVKDSLEDANE